MIRISSIMNRGVTRNGCRGDPFCTKSDQKLAVCQPRESISVMKTLALVIAAIVISSTAFAADDDWKLQPLKYNHPGLHGRPRRRPLGLADADGLRRRRRHGPAGRLPRQTVQRRLFLREPDAGPARSNCRCSKPACVSARPATICRSAMSTANRGSCKRTSELHETFDRVDFDKQNKDLSQRSFSPRQARGRGCGVTSTTTATAITT